MRSLLVSLVALAVTLAAAEPTTPIGTFPYTPGLDVSAIDRTADPCVDFYVT